MTRCPLCHVLHDDPPDVESGRARVCIKCHTRLHPATPKPKAPAARAAKNEKGS